MFFSTFFYLGRQLGLLNRHQNTKTSKAGVGSGPVGKIIGTGPRPRLDQMIEINII